MNIKVYETPITEACGLRYKIQRRQIEGIWQQRHIWYPCANPAYPCRNYYHEDEWIRSNQGECDDHYVEVQPLPTPVRL